MFLRDALPFPPRDLKEGKSPPELAVTGPPLSFFSVLFSVGFVRQSATAFPELPVPPEGLDTPVPLFSPRPSLLSLPQGSCQRMHMPASCYREDFLFVQEASPSFNCRHHVSF